MSESDYTPAGTGPSKKKPLLPIIGAAAALLLTAGAVVGVQTCSAETAQRCADATMAARSFAEASAATSDKASKARALADGATGYDKTDGATTLLTDVDKAKQELADAAVGAECTTRDQAVALMSGTEKAAAKAATLDEVAVKLSDHVTVFQEAEVKRIAAEKKATEEAAASAKKAEEGAAAAKQAEEAVAAAQAAAPAQAPSAPRSVTPAPAGGGYVQAPAPYVPARPAPAPYVPAPAPAPAPRGGWTPPPPGSGPGGGGTCTQIGDHVMCG
jgi:uncharacterized protein YaaQ